MFQILLGICFLTLVSCLNNTAQFNSNNLSEVAITPKPLSTVLVPSPAKPASTTTRPVLIQGFRMPCSCDKGQCGCCTGYILDRFNQKACLNVTYDPDDFAITAAMSMNGKELYKNTVSGKNPPPMCIRLPRLRFIEFCVEFSNIYIASRNMHMCVDAEANWEDITLIEWSFDCLRMGVSGVAVVRPEEGGGLPGNPLDAVDQTDEDYDDSARNNVPTTVKKTASPFHTIVFDKSINQAANQKPDMNLIRVRQNSGGQYIISFIG